MRNLITWRRYRKKIFAFAVIHCKCAMHIQNSLRIVNDKPGNYFRVCKSNESESVSVLCYKLVFHQKWADAQFFMADAQFFGVDAQFFRADAQFFAAGLLWPINYAFCCCWTTFTLEMMVLCHVYPLLSMCKLCLPLTEHVQTLYWACAEIIYIIYPVFDSFDW